ncbi:MAG TPA: DivIVA domain-containing protein [Synergistaceae bacterium]|nr:DivIVA domain-containing protein [Synergistaceae bacterium]
MTQELLSALDVTNRVFRRSLRGYDIAEVDEFLDGVSDTIHIYAEKVRECESTIAGLREQMQEYQNLRDSMQEALIMAQKSAEDRIAAAEQQAQTIVADARSKAESLVQQANADADGIRREMKLLREKRGTMFGELRGFLARFEALLDHQEEEQEEEGESEDVSQAQEPLFSTLSTSPEPPSGDSEDSLKIPPRY